MRNICLLLILTFSGVITTMAQTQKDPLLEFQESIAYFNQIANSNSKTLVFKLLQFTAPFRGGYHETYLDKSGYSYSVRVGPFARQAQRNADLTKSKVKEIKKDLLDIGSKYCVRNPGSQDGQPYSSLIFKKGQKFLRCDFTGKIPDKLQKMLDSLKVEYEKAGKIWYEKYQEEERLLKEKYGDWLEKPGIVRPGTSGSISIKNENTSLIYLKGIFQQVKNDRPPEIPLFYGLVFYPKALLVGGAGGGRSSDPISSFGMSWDSLKKKYSWKRQIRGVPGKFNKPDHQLIVEYNAINGTVSIKNSIYRITDGNLFVIRIDKNWNPKVVQLKIHLDKIPKDQQILELFKQELNDNTLELK